MNEAQRGSGRAEIRTRCLCCLQWIDGMWHQPPGAGSGVSRLESCPAACSVGQLVSPSLFCTLLSESGCSREHFRRPRDQGKLAKPLLQLMSQQRQAKDPVKGKGHCLLST